MAFDKNDWAYNDLNILFQFCKWAKEQTDLGEVFKEGRKIAGDDVFLTMALIGYIHKREKREGKDEIKA